MLIIEDELDIAVLMQRMLAESDFLSDIVDILVKDKQILNKHSDKYKVILLDLCLSDGDGIDFLKLLRKDSLTIDIPVIVVSAKANISKHKYEHEVSGVTAWLPKPID